MATNETQVAPPALLEAVLRDQVEKDPVLQSISAALASMDGMTTRDILLLALRCEKIGYAKGLAFAMARMRA